MVYRLTNLYRTQRNNKIAPAGACQVTAAIMALEATGIKYECPHDVQPEDHLAAILDGPEAKEKLRREYPDLVGHPPREVHAILSWAVNERFIRSRVTCFTTRTSIQEILFRIARHRAASLVSGKFTRAGHIVAVVGFETDQLDLGEAASPVAVDLAQVRRIIIDDPWGSFGSDYRSYDGDDESLPLRVFDDVTREYGQTRRKWAHLFSRDGSF